MTERLGICLCVCVKFDEPSTLLSGRNILLLYKLEKKIVEAVKHTELLSNYSAKLYVISSSHIFPYNYNVIRSWLWPCGKYSLEEMSNLS